jgi:hypothetical protein
MRHGLFVLATLAIAGSLLAQTEDAQDAERTSEVAEAIEALGATVPDAMRETINTLQDEAGPLLNFYYEQAVRKHIVYGVVWACVAVLSAVLLILGIRMLKRDGASVEPTPVMLTLIAVMGLGMGLIAAPIEILNARLYALHDVMKIVSKFTPG